MKKEFEYLKWFMIFIVTIGLVYGGILFLSKVVGNAQAPYDKYCKEMGYDGYTDLGFAIVHINTCFKELSDEQMKMIEKGEA